MYMIEFDDEMTLEAIIKNFDILTEEGIESYIEINNKKIFYNDKDRNEKIKKEFEIYTLSNNTTIKKSKSKREEEDIEFSKVKSNESKKNNEFNLMLQKLNLLNYLKSDATFMFQIGIVLEYTKPEYKEKLLDYYLNIYDTKFNSKEGIKYERHLNYISKLVLILKSDYSDIEKKFKILEIINKINYDSDESFKFTIAVGRINEYIIGGEEIIDLLYLNVFDNKIEELEEEINKKLKKKFF